MESALSVSMWKTSAQPAWWRIRAQGRSIRSVTDISSWSSCSNPPGDGVARKLAQRPAGSNVALGDLVFRPRRLPWKSLGH
jgi:hypothetical protein